MDALYAGVTGWAAADAMLGFPDVPSSQSDLPDAIQLQERMVAFRAALLSDAGAGMDVDAELDRLQADLQALVDDGA